MPSFKKFLPAIAWFILVMVLVCLPGDDLPKADSWMELVMFDKWVHAGLFSILAFLFMLPFARSPLSRKEKVFVFIRIALAASIWGLAIEFIQKYYIPGRSFDLLDWAADSVGAALAFIVAVKVSRKQVRGVTGDT